MQCDLTIVLNDKVFSQSQLLLTTDGHHVRMDHKGVIRFKPVYDGSGEKMDEAVNQLLAEMRQGVDT